MYFDYVNLLAKEAMNLSSVSAYSYDRVDMLLI